MPNRAYNPEAQAARFARSELLLKGSGGRRINIRLQPPAAEALDKLMKKLGVGTTEAIHIAILQAK